MNKLMTLLVGALVNQSQAQIINTGVYINNTSGTFIGSTGNIANNAGGTIAGNGTYQLTGDWVNAGTFTAGISTVVFTGPVNSALTSGAGVFNNLTIQKTGGAQVNLQDAAAVNGILNFNATSGGGYIGANANDLTVGASGSITGAGAGAYVITSGTGRLIKTGLGSTAFLYPVGFNQYNPVTLTQTGASANIGVRCLQHALALTSGVADVSWELTEPSGSVAKNLAMTAQWSGSQELSGFDKTRCGISIWNGSAWDLTYANVGLESGSDPFTRMRSGINTLGTFAVGSKAVAKTVSLSAKVFLQGPYQSGGIMSTALNAAGLIPTGENATAASGQTPRPVGFTHQGWGGGETTMQSILTNNNVVDWVFVELRTPGATPTTVVYTASALLKNDGTIMDENGVSPLTFYGVPDGSYLVSVKHRNHLSVRCDLALTFSSTVAANMDFTDPTKVYLPMGYPNAALKTLSDSKFAMWCGNVLNDSPVNLIKYSGSNNDVFPILILIGSTNILNTKRGYYREDVNMDGVVKYSGSANDPFLILQNIGSANILNTIKETPK